jgi:hypothetical protein
MADFHKNSAGFHQIALSIGKYVTNPEKWGMVIAIADIELVFKPALFRTTE